MPVSEARALMPVGHTRIEPATPKRDAKALVALAQWAHRFSPCVGIGGPEELILDVSGCAGVFGSESRHLDAILDALRKLGFHARAAIAPTIGCAHGVVRFGKERIIPSEGQRDAIAPLPIAALRLDAQTCIALAEVGIERVEHLLDLPRSLLPARYGENPLLRLDQAMGQAMEVIEPIRPAQPPAVERIFDGPTTRWDAIELTIRELLARLCQMLLERECGVTRMGIKCARSDLAPACLMVSLSTPCRDPKHLWSLLRPRIERVNMGFGIEGVAIRATCIGRIDHSQVQHWGDRLADAETSHAVATLLDTLANRLGTDRVNEAECVESHIPERAVRLVPVIRKAKRTGLQPTPRPTPSGDRPIVLLDSPSPIEVLSLAPDGPVHRFRWRGATQAVTTSIGPERIEPEWWNSNDRSTSARDYFKVQSERGRWLWLYRDHGTGRWFVHGVWA